MPPSKATPAARAKFDAATAKLVADMEEFVRTVKRLHYRVHSVAWNHRPIYHANGHRKQWSVTLFGDAGLASRENPVPPVEYVRPARPRKPRK
jgi:uncharacterized membrane-anchored protein